MLDRTIGAVKGLNRLTTISYNKAFNPEKMAVKYICWHDYISCFSSVSVQNCIAAIVDDPATPISALVLEIFHLTRQLNNLKADFFFFLNYTSEHPWTLRRRLTRRCLVVAASLDCRKSQAGCYLT